jgi:hypothetical protein
LTYRRQPNDSGVFYFTFFLSTPCLELLQSYRSLNLNKLASYPVWPAVSNHFTHLNPLHVIVVTLSCNISCTLGNRASISDVAEWPKKASHCLSSFQMFAKIPQRLTSPFALLGDEAKLAFRGPGGISKLTSTRVRLRHA